jgi:hypothetical protein
MHMQKGSMGEWKLKWFTFGITMASFARCIMFKCLWSITWCWIYQSKIGSRLTTWLWTTHVHNYFLKIMHALLIMYFWNLKMWINWLIGLSRNLRIHLECHFKLLIVIKCVLKNEKTK